MTVKEFLQNESRPDTPVGLYTLDKRKPIEHFFGRSSAAAESRYADYEVEDIEYAYSQTARECGYVIYIKEKEVALS